MARFGTLPQLAAQLGVSKELIYKQARAGKIPGAFQIGERRWRVNLDAFEAAQLHAAEAEAMRQVDERRRAAELEEGAA